MTNSPDRIRRDAAGGAVITAIALLAFFAAIAPAILLSLDSVKRHYSGQMAGVGFGYFLVIWIPLCTGIGILLGALAAALSWRHKRARAFALASIALNLGFLLWLLV